MEFGIFTNPKDPKYSYVKKGTLGYYIISNKIRENDPEDDFYYSFSPDCEFITIETSSADTLEKFIREELKTNPEAKRYYEDYYSSPQKL